MFRKYSSRFHTQSYKRSASYSKGTKLCICCKTLFILIKCLIRKRVISFIISMTNVNPRSITNGWLNINCVLCSYGLILWPPRSPEFTLADFYLGGYMKSIIYAQGYSTLDKMWNVTEATGTITHNMPNVFQRTRNSWNNRAQSCIDYNGGPFNIFRKPSETGQMPFCSHYVVYFSFLMLLVVTSRQRSACNHISTWLYLLSYKFRTGFLNLST
jgi:hypothetical protein